MNSPSSQASVGLRRIVRNGCVFVIIMVAVLVLFFAVLNPGQKLPEMSISDVVKAVKAHQVSIITTHEDSNDIEIEFTDPAQQPRTATKESQDTMAGYLIREGVPADQLPEIRV